MNRFKELRNEKKLTQLDLAKILNLSQQTISGYEKGARFPDQQILEKIADFFNVSIDFLLGRTDIRNPEKELSSVEKHLDTKDVKEAIKRLLSQPDLMFQGKLLEDEDKIILNNFIQMGLRTIQDLKRKTKIEHSPNIKNLDK